MHGYWRLISTYPRYVTYAGLHTFFSSLGQTFLFALFVPAINEAYGLSEAFSGAIYGWVTLASALLLWFTGRLLDVVNVRLYSLSCAFVLGLGAIILAYSTSLWHVVLAWLMLRHCGQGLMSLIASTTLARFFTHNRGKALGLKGIGIALGEATLPTLVAALIVLLGWRQAYLILGLSVWCLFMPLSLWLLSAKDPFANPAGVEAPAEGAVAETTEPEGLNLTRSEMFRTPFFWLSAPYLVLMPFLVTGIFYHQNTLAQEKGWSLPLLASMFVGYGLCRLVSSFAIGPVIDRLGAVRLLPFAQLPFAAGLFLLASFDAPVAGFLYLALTGVSLGFCDGITSAMYVQVYGRRHLGSIKSFMGMLAIFVTALSPPLGGWLLGQHVSVSQMAMGALAMVIVGVIGVVLAPLPGNRHHSPSRLFSR